MDNDRIKALKIENIIWLIYVGFAFFGIRANNLEISDIENNNDNNRRSYKNINITIFIIALIIYIYFVNLSYRNYRENHSKNRLIVFIGSLFVLIGGILFLIAEVRDNNDDTIIPNEF